jgi:DNA polymerase-3 subunit beta
MTKVLFSVAQTAVQHKPVLDKAVAAGASQGAAKNALAKRGGLKEALAKLMSSAARKSTMPILKNVLIQSRPDEGKTYLTTTDLSHWGRVELDKALGSAFDVTVHAGTMSEILKAVKEVSGISVSENGSVMVESAGASSQVLGLPAEEYPAYPLDKDEKPLWSSSCDAQALLAGLKAVQPAACSDETRLNICSVLMEFRPKGVRLVTTDSWRMHVKLVRGGPVSSRKFSFLLPSTAIKPLTKFIGKDEKISVGWHRAWQHEDKYRGWLSFSGLGWTLLVREVDGRFPPYKQVVPKEYSIKSRLKVNADSLIQALKSVMPTALDRSTSIRLEPGPTELVIKSSTADVGKSMVKVPCQFRGDLKKIAYNSRLLMETAEFIGPDLEFRITDSIGPTVLYAKEKMAVLMPMRI